MKKALVVLLALTCLSAMAFADDVAWTFGAMVKTGATITLNDSNSGPATIVPYDADDSVASRIRLDAEATLGDFSAHIRVGGDSAGNTADPGKTGFPTVFLNAWWVNSYFMDKMIQLQFGNLDHSVTDTVNKGWGGISVLGAQVVLAPISGLSLGLAIPAAPSANTAYRTLNGALAGTKIGFAYTMTDLVTLKATYMNGGMKNNDSFAAGVAILAVPNLTAQLEVLATNFGDKGVNSASATAPDGTEIFEFVSYVMGPLTPSLEMYQDLYNQTSLKMSLYFKPGIDYMIMTGTNVGATVKYMMNTGTKVNGLSIDPYVAFTFNAKAALKIDAAFTIPDLKTTATWTTPINVNFKFAY
jgi:hypothetical protein